MKEFEHSRLPKAKIVRVKGDLVVQLSSFGIYKDKSNEVHKFHSERIRKVKLKNRGGYLGIVSLIKRENLKLPRPIAAILNHCTTPARSDPGDNPHPRCEISGIFYLGHGSIKLARVAPKSAFSSWYCIVDTTWVDVMTKQLRPPDRYLRYRPLGIVGCPGAQSPGGRYVSLL